LRKDRRKLPPGVRKKDGGFEGRFMQHFIDGHSKRISCWGKSVDDVLAQMADSKRNPRNRANVNKLTVRDFLEKIWLPGIKPDPGPDSSSQPGKVRYSTWALRSIAVNHAVTATVGGAAFGSKALPSLQPEDVDDLFEALGRQKLGTRTQQVVHATLCVALRYALRKRLVRENVMAMVEKPKHEPKPKRLLTRAELGLLLAEANKDPFEHALIVLAASTGAREGELLGLRWVDVSFVRSELKIAATLTRTEIATINGKPKTQLLASAPKTRQSLRTIRLTTQALKVLGKHRDSLIARDRYQPDGWVFPTSTGTPMEKSNFLRRIFHPLVERAELPRITFHSLRGLAATMLAESNLNPKALQGLLGHADIRTTQNLYVQVTDNLREQAKAAMEVILTTVLPGEKNGEKAA
jgi:integrase